MKNNVIFYLDLLFCKLRLRCQAAYFCQGGVRKLPVSVDQKRVGVHSCTVGGDAAQRNQQLGLRDGRCCGCCTLLGLER